MQFMPLPIEGAWAIAIERHEDERGHFARTWCQEEFAAHGIDMTMVQASLSFNRRGGTLRGMHFAWPPVREGKLVRCSRGRIHDVLLDLRPDSPSVLAHTAVVLDAHEYNAVYVPPGVAHGFQSLVDDSEVAYMMTEPYIAQFADGVRFDDPAFGITWPLPVTAIAERDRGYPTFDAAAHRQRFLRACIAAATPAGSAER